MPVDAEQPGFPGRLGMGGRGRGGQVHGIEYGDAGLPGQFETVEQLRAAAVQAQTTIRVVVSHYQALRTGRSREF